MEELTLYLAVAALIAALLLPAVLLAALRREREARLALTQRLKPLGEEIRATNTSVMVLAERLGQLERRLEQQQQRIGQVSRYVEELRLKQDQLDRSAESQASSYAQAVKLAERGASADELVELCGLTRGEAELVTMMYRASGRNR